MNNIRQSKNRGGAFHGVSNFFNFLQVPMTLVEYAEKFCYSEENILIIKGDEELLKSKYPQVYKNMYSCRHNQDKRTALEYAQDIVASWLMEDYFKYAFISSIKSMGINAGLSMSGVDKARQLLPESKIARGADYHFIFNGVSIPVEFVCDYTNHYRRRKALDLRDTKYLNLKDEEVILLGISTLSNEYIIVDFSKEQHAIFKPNPAWGGKNAYTVFFDDIIHLLPFNMHDIVKHLAIIANDRK